MQTLELQDEGSKKNEQNSNSSSDSSSEDNKNTNSNKARNFGRSTCQLRTRGFKTSKRDTQNTINSIRRAEKYNSFTKGSEIPILAGITLIKSIFI